MTPWAGLRGRRHLHLRVLARADPDHGGGVVQRSATARSSRRAASRCAGGSARCPPEWLDPLVFSLKLGSLTALVEHAARAAARVRAAPAIASAGREALVALTLGPLMLPTLVTGVGLLQLFQYRRAARLRRLHGAARRTRRHLPAVRRAHGRDQPARRCRRTSSSRRRASAQRAGRTLRHVVFPLIKSGIVAGAVFAFIHSFTDVNLSLFLGASRRAADHGEDPRLPRVRLRADARRGVGDHAAAAAGPRRRSSSASSGLGDFIYADRGRA